MDDYQAIDLLKELGVFKSIRQHQEAHSDTYQTSFHMWDSDNVKVCRLYFEFKPARIARDLAGKAKFYSQVFDLLSELLDDNTPDVPLLLENKSNEAKNES